MLAQDRPQSLYRPQKLPDQENVLKLLILFWWLADRGTLMRVSSHRSTRDRASFFGSLLGTKSREVAGLPCTS